MLQLLQSARLWGQVEKLRGTKPVVAAVAYANEDHLRLRTNDILICDASDARIASGATSHALLSLLSSRKVQLWHLDRLHAKVIRMADHVVVGSANMTANSKSLVEAAILTDDSDAMRQVSALLSELLASKKIRRIDTAFLRRIASIPVKPGGGGGKRTSAPDREAVVWLVGYDYFTEGQAKKAGEIVKRVTGAREAPPFFRTPLKVATKFGRIQPGDTMLLVDRSESKVRRAVTVSGAFPEGNHM